MTQYFLKDLKIYRDILSLDQRLLSFYALLFTWVHELAYEFPEVFKLDLLLDWINSTFNAELKHYYALDESSKIG